MQMTYSIGADALAIEFDPDGEGARSQEVAPGLVLDFTAEGKLLALELLNASRHVPRATLERLPTPARYLTLVEAAEESGLSPVTLRRQIAAGRLSAVKRGRDWLVDETALVNYLESRDARGRPSAQRAARTRRSRRAPAGE
jgi:excisionase family DNA binding protein